MHKIPALLIFLILVPGCFNTALADSIVVLKNGKQFTTSEYWKENNQVKFHFHGGVIGIPQSSVREVRKVTTPHLTPGVITEEAPAATAADQESTTTAATEPVVAAEKPAENKPAEAQQPIVAIDVGFYKEKKTALLAEKTETLKKLKTAAQEGLSFRDKERMSSALREIDRQLWELAMELKAKNNDRLPPWWSEGQ
ncbi:MAG: hypothetical protein A2521_10535 [Deltaproteobacteria bacterium RIFOXYD12_FULL_57_12]|nr:MAG: hypothetical protein A2521_10535 [Deltaproteobacteria bacterium RIFOXYD12_FULL_57_12]